MKKNRSIAILIFATFFILLVQGCTTGVEDDSPSDVQVAPDDNLGVDVDGVDLTVMSHDSFAISESVISAFEAQNNVNIILLPAGDAGAALNQAILSKQDPLADIFFGVDNTFMSRALAEDLFEAYDSPALGSIDDSLKLDPQNRLLPVDYGDVCLNYDRTWFMNNDLTLPESLMDLTKPEYAGLLVVENPATSSPGLAFLLATIAQFGTAGDYTYLDYWREIREADVLVTDGWEEAYFGYFSAASDGNRPLVVSYASSPPAEIVYADPPIEEPPSGSTTGPGMCFRQVEFIGILRGTKQRELAEALIDYMLGTNFQEDIPLNMFVFPANQEAKLPEVFRAWASIPQKPAYIPPDEIDAHREEWIRAWTNVVLR